MTTQVCFCLWKIWDYLIIHAYSCLCSWHRAEGLCQVLPQQQQQFAGVRTNYDIRIVEAALKTILLCAGEEPRRGLAGQRLLSVDQPATAAVSTSVCISVTLTQFQFSMKADIALGQRINTFMLNPLTPVYHSLCAYMCVCVSPCLSRLSSSSETQGRRWSRRRALEKET